MTESSTKMSNISIIIINYNTRELLRQCLLSLKPGNLPENWSLIVVDNNSPDGSADMVKSDFPSVSLIRMKENGGFPKAVNAGIKCNEAVYYFLLNSDTEVSQKDIKALVTFMDKNREVGGVTPTQVNSRGQSQLAWGYEFTIRSEIRRKRLQAKLDAGDEKALKRITFEKPFLVEWIAGSTMLLRKEALDEAGLMDENIFIFFEDIDICLRIREAGWKIMVNPQVSVIHHRGESAKTEPFNSSIHYRRSHLYVWGKHHSTLSLQFLRIYLVIKFILHLAKTRIASIIKPSERAVLTSRIRHIVDLIKLVFRYKPDHDWRKK